MNHYSYIETKTKNIKKILNLKPESLQYCHFQPSIFYETQIDDNLKLHMNLIFIWSCELTRDRLDCMSKIFCVRFRLQLISVTLQGVRNYSREIPFASTKHHRNI